MATKQTPAMRFLHTNLGIAVLTLVAGGVFSVGGYFYHEHRNRVEKEAIQQAQADQVRAEIRYRLRQWQLHSNQQAIQQKFSADTYGFYDVLLRVPNPNDQIMPMYPVYDEYKDLTFMSLLAKGKSLARDKNEADAFEKPLTLIPSSRAGGPLYDRTLWQASAQFIEQVGLAPFSPRLPSPPTKVRVIQ